MSKHLDAIVFGATGFTGQVVVKDAVNLLKDYKWGIAGRNKSKLESLLKNVGSELGCDLGKISIIIADVSDEMSIKEMAKQCRIVLNCCGPFQLYGEIVVKSCIEAGTHHVDVTAEPQYIDGMQLKYHDWAKEKGVYVVSTCGFDSIPSEMGVVYAERNFEGTINSIETYWENTFDRKDKHSKALFNIATWESIVHLIKNFRKMIELERKMNEKLPCPELSPTLHVKPYVQRPDFSERYFIPLVIGDRPVVERSQRRLYEFEQKRPIQFITYVGFRSLFWTVFLPLYATLIAMIAMFPYGDKLLMKYAGLFTFGRMTRQGPTPGNQQGHHFILTSKAKGWSKNTPLTSKPDKELLTRVSGYSPFYEFSSVALILCARTILSEAIKMPENGGVLPPAAAFYRTSLIEELSKQKYGLKFEVLE